MSANHCAIQISVGFCLLIAWFAAANGWQPLVAVLGAAFMHEGGHCLALRLCGERIAAVRVGICGAVLETDCMRLSYGREIFCVLAGPVGNLLGALISVWPAFTGANLILCAFNLLPLRPLDGGRACCLLISWLAGPDAGERCARWLGVCTGGALICGAGYLIWKSGGNLWLLPAIGGILCAAAREYAGK